jgi:hypothetical protein
MAWRGRSKVIVASATQDISIAITVPRLPLVAHHLPFCQRRRAPFFVHSLLCCFPIVHDTPWSLIFITTRRYPNLTGTFTLFALSNSFLDDHHPFPFSIAGGTGLRPNSILKKKKVGGCFFFFLHLTWYLFERATLLPLFQAT